MSTFTLTMSCLTTSNLPWFMVLTLQVPMQYSSLHHWTLLLSTVTSTTGCCFFFGSVSWFFLELFLHSSPVTYWAPTDLWSSSFSVLSFCLFILFMVFSRQEYWFAIPFSSGPHSVRTLLHDPMHSTACKLYFNKIDFLKCIPSVYKYYTNKHQILNI